jgi:hypothetical protein
VRRSSAWLDLQADSKTSRPHLSIVQEYDTGIFKSPLNRIQVQGSGPGNTLRVFGSLNRP